MSVVSRSHALRGDAVLDAPRPVTTEEPNGPQMVSNRSPTPQDWGLGGRE